MRIRLLGQYVHMSIAALAVIETLAFFLALTLAGLLRFGLDVDAIERYQGPLWPRAALFSTAMVASFLAFGLYSARQRARSIGLMVRVVAAIGAGVALTAVCFFVIPNLWIGRGVLGVAVIIAVALVFGVRVTFARFVNETVFKRRVLVYGVGKNAAAIAKLRRRSDRRGFVLVGFLQPDGEEPAVPGDCVVARSSSSLFDTCRSRAVDEV